MSAPDTGMMQRSVVATTTGDVEGQARGGVLAFMGMPYADSPAGEFRLLPPRRPRPWTGVRPGFEAGPAVPQVDDPQVSRLIGVAPFLQDEGACLNLNVWTPAADSAQRPTMVWIHGGAFRWGRGSDPWFDGRKLAEANDIVVVTLNYRLGPIGFLSLGRVLGEPYAQSGNLGVLDVIQALEWVRDNIAAFGGNPSNVTIAGESAGAGMVMALLAAEGARGLFHGAIIQSGGAMIVDDLDAVDRVTRAYLKTLDLSDRNARNLLSLPVDALLEASHHVVASESWAQGERVAFRPVVDGEVLKRSPLDAVHEGNWNAVPLIIGTTRDEARLSLALSGQLNLSPSNRRRVFERDDVSAEAVYDFFSELYPGASDEDLAAAVVTEHRFRKPLGALADACSSQGEPVWQYRFDWESKALGGRFGACHALDLPFVFNNLDANGTEIFTGPAPPVALAETMSKAWATFARNHSPAWAGLPWLRYHVPSRETMLFAEAYQMASDPARKVREFWETTPVINP